MRQVEIGVPAHSIHHGGRVELGRRRIGLGVKEQAGLGLDKGHGIKTGGHKAPLGDDVPVADGQRLGRRQQVVPRPAGLGIVETGGVKLGLVKVDEGVGSLHRHRPDAPVPLHAVHHVGVERIGIQVRVRLKKVRELQQGALLHSLAGGGRGDDVGSRGQQQVGILGPVAAWDGSPPVSLRSIR